MKNKSLIIFLVVLAVIGFGWGFYETTQTKQAVAAVENDASRALYELMNAADELTVLTAKAIAVNDNDNRAALCAEISSKAYVAQENLSMLPVYNTTLSRTERFLNQIGDFSASLVAKAARNQSLSSTETETMKSLNAEVTKVSKALHKLDDAKENVLSYQAIKTANKAVNNSDYEKAGLAVTALNNVNDSVDKTPALIYDGPYSDHLENKGQIEISGDTIDEKAAKSKATALFGDDYTYTVYGKSSKAAGIAVYTVALKEHEKDEDFSAYLDLSVNGGHPVQYTATNHNGKKKISEEKALDNAAEFLQKAGYDRMKAGYYIIKSNVLTANYTYDLDGVTVYPDMIKVSVDMSDGSIVGLDAKNYLEFHKDRSLPSLIMTEDAAKARLAQGIAAVTCQKAIIPKKDGSEALCYEFRCRENDTDYLIYINAENGKEEDIFIVMDDESGTFTM